MWKTDVPEVCVCQCGDLCSSNRVSQVKLALEGREGRRYVASTQED